MSATDRKQAIFQTYRDRQAARRAEMAEELSMETAEAVRGGEVETRMEIGAAVAFLLSGADREAAAREAV